MKAGRWAPGRACERLLPHVMAATGHAERLGVAGEQAGWLLDRAATYLRYRGQYWQARSIAERALAVTEQALGPDDPEIAWRRSNLGTVLWDLGDLAGARVQLERALEISEVALGPDHPDRGHDPRQPRRRAPGASGGASAGTVVASLGLFLNTGESKCFITRWPIGEWK
jgi:tetratricopeptide (TPR) repeat protein